MNAGGDLKKEWNFFVVFFFFFGSKIDVSKTLFFAINSYCYIKPYVGDYLFSINCAKNKIKVLYNLFSWIDSSDFFSDTHNFTIQLKSNLNILLQNLFDCSTM